MRIFGALISTMVLSCFFFTTFFVVSYASAQSISDCDQYSDVRPSPTSMSPREYCQCEIDSSYCITPIESNVPNEIPEPPAPCTDCGSCSIAMIFGNSTIFTNAYSGFENCVSNLRQVCGRNEYSNCYIKYYDRWRFISWSFVRVENASCRTK